LELPLLDLKKFKESETDLFALKNPVILFHDFPIPMPVPVKNLILHLLHSPGRMDSNREQITCRYKTELSLKAPLLIFKKSGFQSEAIRIPDSMPEYKRTDT